jgi:alpha-tubulin suppressor-like RCC1 family protein
MMPTLMPATTPTLTNARAIAAGIKHACAVVSDTDIECWGDNSSGELGDGTTTLRPTPASVALPK